MSEAKLIFGGAVVLGGRGAVGRLLCSELSGHVAELTVADRHAGDDRLSGGAIVIEGDVGANALALQEALGAADVAIVSLPEDAAIAALPMIVACLPRDALLVDTLSVKTPFAAALATQDPAFEALSINPMFGPSMGFSGQNTVVVELRSGPKGARFCNWLESLGTRLTMLGVEQHDRATATLQTATHAAILGFGLALAQLDYDIDALGRIATPPHKTLLALLARILSGSPEVCWDIQTSNPFAREARAGLRAGLARLDDTLHHGDPEAFRALLSDLGSILEAQQETLAMLCADLFDRQRESQDSIP